MSLPSAQSLCKTCRAASPMLARMDRNERRIAALIVAAGRGTRAPGDGPKQYRPLGGESVLGRAVRAFVSHDAVTDVLAVIHPDDGEAYAQSVSPQEKLRSPVHGGTHEAKAFSMDCVHFRTWSPDVVLVHDAARPLVTDAVISSALIAPWRQLTVPFLSCLASMPCAGSRRAGDFAKRCPAKRSAARKRRKDFTSGNCCLSL